MGKRILKFPEEGLKQLQFFMEGLSFPVAVAAYSEQDIGKLSYLIRLLQRGYIRSTKKFPAGYTRYIMHNRSYSIYR